MSSSSIMIHLSAIALLIGSVALSSAQSLNAAPPSPVLQPQATGSVAAETASPLERLVTLDLHEVTLRAALHEISTRGGVQLVYSSRVVPLERRLTLRVSKITVRDALAEVLRGTGVEAEVMPSGTVMLVKRERRAAGGWVAGQVTDSATKRPLEHAVVSIAGDDTTGSAFSSDSGWYVFHVPVGRYVVRARYLGYAPAQLTVVVADSQQLRADFALRMGMSKLQEVVTTATGQQRRLELGNDITILNVDSIVATQPISSVTDLLEGRVPGLTVQHTSGAPGDPSRLRLRGTSSVLRSNDPILILDGIRVYAAQSDSQSANLAKASIAAPSPLDQLDPNSIQTIEVMKGPSAATLYGPDAANGVIVVTTKRGRAGPARWTASVSRGMSSMPGNYPDGLYRWGHDYFGNVRLCPLTDFGCHADSLVSFQALNNPRYSVLGQGASTDVSLGVSGGNSALTYAITGSHGDETGILQLPDVEAARFPALHGGASAPSWMSRPQELKRWSGTSRLTAKINDRTDASLSTTLTRESQQRSTLEQQLSALMTTYIDPATGTYWRAGSGPYISIVDALVPDFYQRATDDATNFTNAANLTWRPRSWLTTSADGGLNAINRQDEVLLPRNMLPFADSTGRLSMGHGSTMVSTVNLRAVATAPLPLGFHLQFAAGANYIKTALSSLVTGVSDLAPGTSSVNGAGRIDNSSQQVSDVTSFGWYVEPTFTHQRFTISTGLRLDGSSSFGTHVNLPAFPKLGVSWLLSEEPFFPFKKFFDVFRVRAAYGRAGVWPLPADQLRLYTTSRPWLDGNFQDVTEVSTLGNSQLRPERSSEMEGGFDADMLHDRLSIGITGYRKMRYDAIMGVPVAPSVHGGGSFLENIGVIRNTGLELNVTTQLVRTDPLAWSTTFNLSRNHNLVTELGPGVLPFGNNDARVVAGYPLFGRWARPILAYADANHDGVIERSEVLLGDSLIYMGASEPNFEANVFSNLSFLRGAVTVSASFSYQDGLTQRNNTLGGVGQAIFSPGVSDPSSPFGVQAAVAVTNETSYGVLQTVNTLRLNSLSVAFNASPSLARRFRTSSLSIALQGTNVGLWTNYSGKDPNENAFSTGNAVADTGVLPIPRSWFLSVRASY
jgi:TonB-linked SusC/RagA family outer membrane protein